MVARRRSTVLITGETGTGKEVVAQSIHAASNRARLPMVSVNCSALPDTLLEAELFGHVKGAFTGAPESSRAGRFEQAHRGTIFLDEIGDLPVNLQAKLLRVLQEREFQRLGSSETVRVDRARDSGYAHRPRRDGAPGQISRRFVLSPERGAHTRSHPCASAPPISGFWLAHFIEKICQAEEIPTKQISPRDIGSAGRARLAGQCAPVGKRGGESNRDERRASGPVSGRFSASPAQTSDGIRRWLGCLIAVPDQGLDFEHTVGGIERNILEQALKKDHGQQEAGRRNAGPEANHAHRQTQEPGGRERRKLAFQPGGAGPILVDASCRDGPGPTWTARTMNRLGADPT